MEIGLGLGLSRLQGGGYAFVNAEAAALVARFTTPPPDARKALIDTLVGALKTGGVWSKLDAFYMMAAADAQAAQRNWIADAYNLTPVAAPTFVADRGYSGDGATSYLETGFNVSSASGRKYLQNSASLGVGILSNVQDSAQFDVGTTGVYAAINARRTSSQARFFLNVASGVVDVSISPDTSIGLTAFSRTGASASQPYKNGAAIGAVLTNASVSPPSQTIRLCAGGGFFSTRQVSDGFFGGSLTAAEHLAVHNARQAYLQAIGAI